MAVSFTFNPFTGNFDEITSVALAPVGSSPNASGATLSADQVLTLQPADNTNPGLLTAIAQTIGGDKTFTGTTVVNAITASSLAVTSTTTLNTTLTGPLRATFGVVSASPIALISDVSGVLPIANGGTGVSSLTAHAVLFGGTTTISSATPTVAVGVPLISTGATSDPTFGSINLALTQAVGTSTLLVGNGGTGQSVLSTNAVILGNGGSAVTFVSPGTSGNVLTSNGTTWTSASISSPVAPTIQKFLSGSGTYTTPTSPRTPLYIKVTIAGGGGGGGATNTGSNTDGGTGGTSTFGTTLLSAVGGSGGLHTEAGGAGGTASLGTGPLGLALSGGMGSSSQNSNSSAGGSGGNNALGGGGGGGNQSAVGFAGATNTGGGGGGAGGTGSAPGGGGGGAGGYLSAIITSPTTTYAYVVGAAGAAGTAPSGGTVGGLGGSGVILVEEFYQ